LAQLLDTAPDAAVGRYCYEVLHGLSGPAADRCLIGRVRESRRRETKVIRRGNRWFTAVADPVVDESGDVIAIVHIFLADPTYDFSAGTPLSVGAATGLLAGSGDVDGEPLTAALATNPAHGTVTVNADGSFVYTPNPGYAGADSFVYQVSDGNGGTAVGTVTLLDPPPATGGFQVTAVEGLSSGLQGVGPLTDADAQAVAADAEASFLTRSMEQEAVDAIMAQWGKMGWSFVP
jgi:hypothetical protein